MHNIRTSPGHTSGVSIDPNREASLLHTDCRTPGSLGEVLEVWAVDLSGIIIPVDLTNTTYGIFITTALFILY